MSPHSNRAVDYFRFTSCSDRPFTAACPHDPKLIRTFCFADDAWHLVDLLKPHEHKSLATIGFSEVAPWLAEDAKCYIAHLWLQTETCLNALHQLMVSIRHLGRLVKGFTGTAIDLRARHAKEFSRRFCELNLSPGSYNRTRRDINWFMGFVRRQHPDARGNDFKVEFPRSKTFSPQHRPLEQAKEARIDSGRLTKIIDACTADFEEYLELSAGYIDPAEKPKEYRADKDRGRYLRRKYNLPDLIRKTSLNHLLGRALKAQAVTLAICVGRRAAAICNAPFAIRTKRVVWTNEVGQQEEGVTIRFRERKIRNADEEIFCPGAFGELALQAIKNVKQLTQRMRQLNPVLKDFLFIVPGRSVRTARVLGPQQINEYMNGQGGNGQGIRQRYDIPGPKITTHNFRHTRATNMWMGGMQVHEVAYDLGHASAEMAIRHYIVGNEESKRRLQFLMDHGALSGALEDLVGGAEMVQTRLGRRHVEIMRRQGRILTPTRYGYCALPASSGPCPTAGLCYLGPGGAGAGCDHHVLSPDALSVLEEDKEALESTIAEYSDNPEYAAWVANHRNQLSVVNRTIERATALLDRTRACDGGHGGCNCAKGTR